MFCLGINIVKIQDTTSIKYTGGGKAPTTEGFPHKRKARRISGKRVMET